MPNLRQGSYIMWPFLEKCGDTNVINESVLRHLSAAKQVSFGSCVGDRDTENSMRMNVMRATYWNLNYESRDLLGLKGDTLMRSTLGAGKPLHVINHLNVEK